MTVINQKKRAYHFETSSLLQLKLILSEAKKESPPRARNEQKDLNEELALKLLASMKKSYRKVNVIARSVIFPTTSAHACTICLANRGEQSPLNQKIASPLQARNDKKLEP